MWEYLIYWIIFKIFEKLSFPKFSKNVKKLGSLVQRNLKQDVDSGALALHAGLKLHNGLAMNHSGKVNG